MYIYFSNEKKNARTFLKEFSTVLFRNSTCIGTSFSCYSKKVRFWQLLKVVANNNKNKKKKKKNITGICINRGCKVAHFQRYSQILSR